MAHSLYWHVLSDITCLAYGGEGKRDGSLSEAAAASFTKRLLEGDPDGRLRSVFGTEAPERQSRTEPELARLVRDVTVEFEDERWEGFAWDDDALAGLRLRIVEMPADKEGDALLTPTVLYLCWKTIATPRPRLKKALADRDLTPETSSTEAHFDLPSEALKGDHVWLETAMQPADTLAKHLPALLSSAPGEARAALDVMAAVEAFATSSLWEGAAVVASDRHDLWEGLKPVETGRFETVPREDLVRVQSFFERPTGKGGGRGSLVLHLGTDKNPKGAAPKAVLYPRWQCGGFGRLEDDG